MAEQDDSSNEEKDDYERCNGVIAPAEYEDVPRKDADDDGDE